MSTNAVQPRQITPADIRPTLRASLLANRVPFYWGPPGVGKSAIAEATANELGIAYVDIRLSMREPTDMRGMPIKVEENGVTIGVVWVPPTEFPIDVDQTFVRDVEAIETVFSFKKLNPKGKNHIHHLPDPQVSVRSINPKLYPVVLEKGMTEFMVKLVDKDAADGILALAKTPEDALPQLAALESQSGRITYRITGEAHALICFDEMNSADPTILAACYQIVHDRRIGEFEFGKHVGMCAAGNRADDRGVAFQMPEPLLNRLTHLLVKEHAPDWLKWAIAESQEHPLVVSFIDKFNQKLFDHRPGSGQLAFATPRSWSGVSTYLKTFEDPRCVLTEQQERALIYGTVGDALGMEFFEFREIAEKLPSADDILLGRVTHLDRHEGDRKALGYMITLSILFNLFNEDKELQERGIDDLDKGPERTAWYGKVDRYIDFALANFSGDINVMGIRAALQQMGIPINGVYCKKWGDFVQTYRAAMVDV